MKRHSFPPGPKSFLPGKIFLQLRENPLSFFTRLAQDYGDISYFKIGRQHFYFINHPDLVKDVLVNHSQNFKKGRALERAKRFLGEGLLTSEEPLHKQQRRLVQPAFSHQRLPAYAATMSFYARQAGERWRDGIELDLRKEMARLALAIVGKALFNAEVEGQAREVGRALTEILHLFDLVSLPVMEWVEKLPLPGKRRFDQARARLNKIIFDLVEEHQRSGQDQQDVLSMLLQAQAESGMSLEQLRDEAMTIFLAGHETTANALSWTFYLLAQHPEIEARLHQELDTFGREHEFGLQDLKALPYTEMVFCESMRIFPPAWIVGRRALLDYRLGEWVVPQGAILTMSQFVMHRDPRYFPDPLRFNPLRFLPDEKAQRPTFSYFPFGAGPRQCIGEGFAMMEGVLVLASLARRWRFEVLPEPKVEPEALITLRPKHGIQVRVKKR